MPRSSAAPMLCFIFAFLLLVLMLLQQGCSMREKKMDDPLFANGTHERYVAPPPEELSAAGDELGSAYFPTDSAVLTDAAREVLREDARWLKSHPEASIQIEGYCDVRGTHAYNLPLGQKRAEVAKRYLISQGVPENRINAISYGRVDDQRPRAWANNRRASFLIFYSSTPAAQATR